MSKTITISEKMYELLRERREAGDHTSLDSALRELHYQAQRYEEQAKQTNNETNNDITNETTNTEQ